LCFKIRNSQTKSRLKAYETLNQSIKEYQMDDLEKEAAASEQ
jgi:hypothetical protein